MKFNSETDLAKVVIDWLEGNAWTVYQEVATVGGVADIVAAKGGHCWIIECKRSFGLDVISQALSQKNTCSWVSVAVPKPAGYSRTSLTGVDVCRQNGIGVLRVSACVQEELKPVFNRNGAKARLVNKLKEEQKTMGTAGSNRGGHWTPFKTTAKKVTEYLNSHPGCTARELIDSITHHWSDNSARATVIDLLRSEIIPGFEVRADGRKLRIWPQSEAL